ncbi:phenylalanyl-tRNA synthetase subunit alpha [Stappia sp. ICDLI1TA098]
MISKVLHRALGALLLAVFLSAATTPLVHAQTAGAAAGISAAQRSFVDVCADKSGERGRLRFCDAYFRDGLGVQADPVLYLRDRITTLRASQEANAESNYESFLTAVGIVAFLSIATMLLVVSERRISGIAKWAIATSAAALLVIVATVTVGWLDKYRAEDAAMLELGLLRDQVEVEASLAISSGGTISDAQLRRWTDRLHEIGVRFAENYGGASLVPDLDRFTPSN